MKAWTTFRAKAASQVQCKCRTAPHCLVAPQLPCTPSCLDLVRQQLQFPWSADHDPGRKGRI